LILVRSPERKIAIGKSRYRWEDSVKMVFREKEWR
jgi:hypothetical protein